LRILGGDVRSGASKEATFRSQPTLFSFFDNPEDPVSKRQKEDPGAAEAALADPSLSRLERGF
jgi:hypothetical protein